MSLKKEMGIFPLSTLNEGAYEIAVSCVGYETDKRVVITDEYNLYIIRLKLNIIEESETVEE